MYTALDVSFNILGYLLCYLCMSPLLLLDVSFTIVGCLLYYCWMPPLLSLQVLSAIF